MDTFGRSVLTDLLQPREGACLSLYLPTHPVGAAGQQDTIRLRNLLDEADDQLQAAGLPATWARDMLQPARELPDDATWWDARGEGLALFLEPGGIRRYRLPLAFEELVFVGSRYVIRPLLPLVNGHRRFFLLTLSQNHVRFFQGDEHELKALDLPSLPVNMEETLNYVSVDRGEQTHSAMQGRHGKQAAVFHGQGGRDETRKEDIEEFFRLVEQAVHPVLESEEAPLLLAGVEYLLPIYQSVNRYPHVLEADVTGNYDRHTPQELHEQAWPRVSAVPSQARQRVSERLDRAMGTDQACLELAEIVVAATSGRVEALYLDAASPRWGRTAQAPEAILLHVERGAGDEDLLDLAAVETLRHGGQVFAVAPEEVPGGDVAAALLRY